MCSPAPLPLPFLKHGDSDQRVWAETGADVLFVEPRSKAADVGITVSPIRIRSLEQFGDLAAVGERLLTAERSKVLCSSCPPGAVL